MATQFRRTLEAPDLVRMNLPEAYWRANVATVPESVRPAVTRYLTKMDEMMTRGAGLMVLGAPGVGKTAIAALAAKEARMRGYTVYFTTVWELREGIRSMMQFDGEMTLMERAQAVDMLVLDDIRPDDLDKGWFGRSEIEALAAYRAARRKVTIITAQAESFTDFASKVKALVRATEETVVPLIVVGPNLREAQKADVRRAVLGD
jgi:DNA replication protein DnaC